MLDDWNELADFKTFLNSLNLNNFNYHEVLSGVGKVRGNVRNEPPPKEIWHNIAPTILVLDHLRDHFDVPVTINSTYRSPLYNPLIGGEKRSQHTAYCAVDFNVRGIHPTVAAEQLLAWQTDEKWFSSPIELHPTDVNTDQGLIKRTPLQTRVHEGVFQFLYKGGVGFYNTFTHMDTRGMVVKWDSRRHDSEQRSRSLSLEPVELE